MTGPAPQTVGRLLALAVERNHGPAYRFWEGASWRELGWREVDSRVREIGTGLKSLGVERGDRIALTTRARVEWLLCDLAIAAIGGVSVLVPDDLPPESLVGALGRLGVVVAICDDGTRAATIRRCRRKLPLLREVVTVDRARSATAESSLDLLAARGVARAASNVNRR